MRKLVESTFVTLEGVISAPQEWSPPYWDDEHAAYASELLSAADALLLGRKTYEVFAETWPNRSGDPFTDRDQRHAQVRGDEHGPVGDLELDGHPGRRRR
jgi:hypothetical protein